MEYPQPSSNGEVTNTDSRFTNLIKSLMTKSEYIPTQIDPADYDMSKLATAGADAVSSMSSAAQNQAAAESQAAEQNSQDKEAEADEDEKGMKKDDESDGNLLAMIFGIVKVGINIVKKGKTIAQGFKEVPIGLGQLIANVAIMTAILGIDTFNFAVQLCVYLFKLLICTVQKLTDIPKCAVFYFIDVVIFIVVAVIVSILFMIDMIFMIKSWVGMSCVELFFMAIGMIKVLDELIYSYAEVHVFRYPEPIINLCYRCSTMGDTSGFWTAVGRMFDDIFVMLPSGIGDPISEIIKGFKHIFAFFG
jgi:ribosomal protein L12E/L44/L45/RPP1/RPP2